MIDFSGDADIFINEFAVTATVHEKNVSVLFDVDNAEDMLQPIIHVKTADAIPITKGMQVTVDGINYGVISWYDLDGMTILSCNKEQF